MPTNFQNERGLESGENSALDQEIFSAKACDEARVRSFRRWARVEAALFVLFALSPFAIWVWDSFFGLINRGFQAAASEIVFSIQFHALLAAAPIVAVFLVFRSTEKQNTTIPFTLVYGRYLSWTWMPLLVALIVGVFDVNEIHFKDRRLSGYATEYWPLVLLVIHMLWNSCVLFTLRGTHLITLSCMPTLLLGNVILLAHGLAGWFFLVLAGL